MTYFADRTFVLNYSQDNDIENLREVLDRVTLIDSDGERSHNWFKDKDGYTALMVAVNRGHIECVKLLLEYNAAQIIDEKEVVTGKTCCHMASAKGYNEILKLILDAKADPNSQQNNGNTPLIWTCANGHVESTKLLLQYGADVNILNRDNWSPAIYAAHNNHIDCLQIIIKNANLDIQTNDGYTALHYSVGLNLVDITTLLLEHSCRRDLKNIANKVPAELAKTDQIKALLDCSIEDLKNCKNDDLYFYKKLCDREDVSNDTLRIVLRKVLDTLSELKSNLN